MIRIVNIYNQRARETGERLGRRLDRQKINGRGVGRWHSAHGRLQRPPLVHKTGPGKPPVTQVWTRKLVQFGSWTVQKPDFLLLGSSNPAPYPSTCRFGQVWLDPVCPISSFAFQVVLFMVPFRYRTVNCEILTMVHRWSLWIYWPPLCSNYVDKRSLTHPGNQCQRNVNDLRSSILGNQSGHWLQIVITEVLASFIGKSRSDMLPAPSWKWASYEHQRFKVSQLG